MAAAATATYKLNANNYISMQCHFKGFYQSNVDECFLGSAGMADQVIPN